MRNPAEHHVEGAESTGRAIKAILEGRRSRQSSLGYGLSFAKWRDSGRVSGRARRRQITEFLVCGVLRGRTPAILSERNRPVNAMVRLLFRPKGKRVRGMNGC
jgi:hypothetical protein